MVLLFLAFFILSTIWGIKICVTKKFNRYMVPFEQPTRTITGIPAVITGVMITITSIGFIAFCVEWLEIDQCLDLGGSYNYTLSKCEY